MNTFQTISGSRGRLSALHLIGFGYQGYYLQLHLETDAEQAMCQFAAKQMIFSPGDRTDFPLCTSCGDSAETLEVRCPTPDAAFEKNVV